MLKLNTVQDTALQLIGLISEIDDKQPTMICDNELQKTELPVCSDKKGDSHCPHRTLQRFGNGNVATSRKTSKNGELRQVNFVVQKKKKKKKLKGSMLYFST